MSKTFSLKDIRVTSQLSTPLSQSMTEEMGTVEYWQRRYQDLEASFYQVKAELTLQRDRASKISTQPIDQLCAARLLLEEREDTVQELRRQLTCRENEVNTLKDELMRTERLAAANSVAKDELCEQLLDQLGKAKEDLRLKNQELMKHRTEGQLRHHSLYEISGRQRYLEVDKARHGWMVDLLQAERDMWLSRSEHYERNYDKLRRSLCDLVSPEIVEVASYPAPSGPVPQVRRHLYHRRLCRGGAVLDR